MKIKTFCPLAPRVIPPSPPATPLHACVVPVLFLYSVIEQRWYLERFSYLVYLSQGE